MSRRSGCGTPILAAAVLALMVGCAYANAPSHWPSRGAFVTVVNDTQEPVSIVARSEVRGGHVVKQRLWPNARITFRWPWIDANGQLLAGPYFTQMFGPWDASYWCWRISQPTATKGKCA